MKYKWMSDRKIKNFVYGIIGEGFRADGEYWTIKRVAPHKHYIFSKYILISDCGKLEKHITVLGMEWLVKNHYIPSMYYDL